MKFRSTNQMDRFLRASSVGALAILSWLLQGALAFGLTLDGDTHRAANVTGETVIMNGHSELHLSGSGNPLSGGLVHLNSEDAWVFLHAVKPSEVNSSVLSRIRVKGALANAGTNLRVVQYAQGAVIIPQGEDFLPLEVFTGENFAGQSRKLRPYQVYQNSELGIFADRIRSFTLKRGWMVTLAANEGGSEDSRVFIAQDSDLEVPVLTSSLDRRISFVRVFPWRWVSKKGTCDTSPTALNAQWHYNWNISLNSSPDWEYVAIKQQPHWPGLNQNWEAREVNHLSGYNEPDNPVEDAYQNLSPQGSTTNAVDRWPELLATGLRVGAPAVTDAGLGWLTDFMNKANAAGHRVDYVPVHYYRSYWNKSDPQGAANQMYQFLESVHNATGLPVWVTEFNNGANWTDNAHDPSVNQNRDAIQAMIQMMDNTPWIERYAVYSRVEWFRQTHYDDGWITPMGAMYRDHDSPIGYRQTIPNMAKNGVASFLFDGNTRDTSGNGNVCLTYGTPRFITGKRGGAIELDGESDSLKLTGRFGDSTDFTFSAWVRWDGGGNWQRIFDFGDGTSRYMFLTPKSGSNTLRFAIKNGGGEQRLDASPLTPGVWTHVAVTIAGNTGKLFVNGSRVAVNNSMSINPSQLGTESNFLGDSQFSADPLFDGALDDLRIFNFARSDGRIAAFAGSAAPEFSAELERGEATVNLPFFGSLADAVSGGVGSLQFDKIEGPGWLAMGADGSFSGVPKVEDIGKSVVLVSVTDANKNSSTVYWSVEVAAPDPMARLTFEDDENCVLGNVDLSLANGAALVSEARGRVLAFDGSDDHAILPEGIASSEAITVASWVRWDGGNAWQRIFDFGNGTDSYLMMTPRSNGNRLEFAIKNGGESQRLEAAQLPAGVWKHVAVTLGGGIGRLYVDGVLVASNASISIKPSEIKASANYLGRSQWPDPYFDGRLDDFQVFPRELSAGEIAGMMGEEGPTFDRDELTYAALEPGDIFVGTVAPNVSGGVAPLRFEKISGPSWLLVDDNGRVSGVPGAEDSGENFFGVQVTDADGLSDAISVEIPVNPPVGLWAHYQLDGNAIDRVAGSNGGLRGGPVFQEGFYDQALDFDGANDYLQLPSGIVSSLNDATFAARLRWDGGGNWQRIFDFGNNTSQYIYLTPKSSSGTLRFGITLGGSGSQQILETSRPREGEWFHVAVTLSGNTGILYVNGVEADRGSITLNPSNVAPTRNYLGESQWPDPHLNGVIDDFRIYNRALSAVEVSGLAVPSEPTVVEAGYDSWASIFDFAAGEEGPDIDADRDGVANVFEWLHGTDPLDAGSNYVTPVKLSPASELGLVGGERYLTLRARVRKVRPGVTLVAEGSVDLENFDPGQAVLVNAPVDLGEFEMLTWYFPTPVSDQARAFLRVKPADD